MPPTQTHHTPNHQDILNDLVLRGADLARRVHEQADAVDPSNPEAPTLEAITTAFDRIARAVRRTVALAEHLARKAAEPTAPQRTAARATIIRSVEDAIDRHERTTAPGIHHRTLYAELNERLDDPALEFDLATRSPDDIIEDICRDLGIAVQGRSWVWKRRTPADVAALRARAAAPPNTNPPTHPALTIVPKKRPPA